MVALMPGQSPPEVKIPILMTLLFELLFFRSVKIEKKEKKDREADK
ncbi:hypothetical protein HMPREF2531_04763 [Bacteroides intestinalis]|jgi:hypothetical protein|uniref:Uncharacterized protein n=2 Tax=Bacteroides TaxID=816 RepID=A0A139KT82_9BACE|nr:hypothetical protein BACCELL_01609 [Bacteroides cellulosilyticus DSM 14838]KXT42402.1 hypothetical protein HMPREF2531_04763 [Bacteroides intestinalis]